MSGRTDPPDYPDWVHADRPLDDSWYDGYTILPEPEAGLDRGLALAMAATGCVVLLAVVVLALFLSWLKGVGILR